MSLSSVLPEGPGLLPYWLLTVALTGIGNSIQSYSTLHYTQRIYNGQSSDTGKPASETSSVTPLSARTFGTWSFVSSLVRFYCAYDITNKPLYDLAMWTCVTGMIHFGLEWSVFKSGRIGVPLLSPVVVAGATFAWMFTQRETYLG
ncbi:Erg28 protein [Viridothelium virens]|uniref:Erg28 protein n=1 Tax=Viridothelium virens TaxID=1048519 RepID=A0A6A6HHR6_VIRVR|nr:Erg28 protein [Viridothelium virens]